MNEDHVAILYSLAVRLRREGEPMGAIVGQDRAFSAAFATEIMGMTFFLEEVSTLTTTRVRWRIADPYSYPAGAAKPYTTECADFMSADQHHLDITLRLTGSSWICDLKNRPDNTKSSHSSFFADWFRHGQRDGDDPIIVRWVGDEDAFEHDLVLLRLWGIEP